MRIVTIIFKLNACNYLKHIVPISKIKQYVMKRNFMEYYWNKHLEIAISRKNSQ